MENYRDDWDGHCANWLGRLVWLVMRVLGYA